MFFFTFSLLYSAFKTDIYEVENEIEINANEKSFKWNDKGFLLKIKIDNSVSLIIMFSLPKRSTPMI